MLKFLLLRGTGTGTGTVYTIVILLFIILLFYTHFYCFHGFTIVQQQWTQSLIAIAIPFADIDSKANIMAQAKR